MDNPNVFIYIWYLICQDIFLIIAKGQNVTAVWRRVVFSFLVFFPYQTLLKHSWMSIFVSEWHTSWFMIHTYFSILIPHFILISIFLEPLLVKVDIIFMIIIHIFCKKNRFHIPNFGKQQLTQFLSYKIW